MNKNELLVLWNKVMIDNRYKDNMELYHVIKEEYGFSGLVIAPYALKIRMLSDFGKYKSLLENLIGGTFTYKYEKGIIDCKFTVIGGGEC